MRRVATERDAASARSAFRNITAELFARAVYLRFDRAHRQLQLGSDLLVGVFLEKAQLDQFPVAGRHSFEKRLDRKSVV